MKLQIYAIRDEKAEGYAIPFFLANDGLAIRAFGDLALDKQSALNRHSGDYCLYCIGSFDDFEGSIEGLKVPKYLSRASDFLNKLEVSDAKENKK